MYKFVALLVVLSSVSLTLASPYGSRLMASSGYGAAPAPLAPAPGIFEVPAATPFMETTTVGYGQQEIQRDLITEAPVTQGYGSAPLAREEIVTMAPELPVAPVTQGYGSAPVATEAPILDVVTQAPELPVAPVTQGYGSAEPVTQAYGSAQIAREEVVTMAPELPVAPVTQGYGSAPLAREEVITQAPVTQGYGSAPLATEAPILDVVTQAPVTQGYASAEPVTQAYGSAQLAREEVITMAPELPVAPVTQGYGSAPVLKAASSY